MQDIFNCISGCKILWGTTKPNIIAEDKGLYLKNQIYTDLKSGRITF